MIAIHQDWKEFLEALLSENTKFLLIGGHALAFHVEARLTEDLDVFVEPSLENAKRVFQALKKFGFGAALGSHKEFAKPGQVFMLGRKPWRIDVLTGIDGVTFEEAWAGRQEVNFHGVNLYVIGREALVRNKSAAGRKKDLMDVELLMNTGRKVKRKKRKAPKRRG